MLKLSALAVFLVALPLTIAVSNTPETIVAEQDSELPAEANSVDALFEADRAFAADASLDRIDGWVSWFDTRGVRLPIAGAFSQGHDAIRAADSALFADSSMELRWDPEVGAVIAPGELGFTRGRYELVKMLEDGDKVLGVGTYLSIWRWTKDGWKVALDTGVPDQN